MTKRLGASLVCLVGFGLACSSSGGSPDGGSDAAQQDASDGGASNTLLAWTGVYAGALTNLVFDNFTVAPGARCATQKIGACYVIDCTAAGPTPTAISSGPVELYSSSNTLLTITPQANGIYGIASNTSALWSGGNAIGIRSTGLDLPKFDVPLTAPATVTVTNPSPDAGSPTISRTSGFTAAWSAASGTVTIAASQVASGATDLTQSLRFICEFDGASGTGSVPATVTGVLSNAAPVTSLNIGGAATADITVGGYPLHVYAINAQTWAATVQ